MRSPLSPLLELHVRGKPETPSKRNTVAEAMGPTRAREKARQAGESMSTATATTPIKESVRAKQLIVQVE